WTTADGTATAGSGDYAAASGTLTFNPGETSKTVSVAVNGDTVTESNETFYVNLSGATNATVARPQGTGTILNADNPPAITVNDVTVTEGTGSTVYAVFTVSLNQAGTQPITVTYSTSSGSATSGTDFTAVSGTLTFAPGETSKTVSVAVTGDT